MKDKIREIINSSIENNPSAAQAAINDVLREKAKLALETRQNELAKNLFNGNKEENSN